MILALVFMTSASFSSLSAKEKKDKKQQTGQKKTVVLTTKADSLSFAAGMSLTNGLMPYLKQQYGVPESQMADVVRGFKDAASHRKDSAFTAYAAGVQIAEMVKNRMLPSLNNDLDNVDEDLVYNGFAASLEKDFTFFTDSAAQKIFADGRAVLVEKKNEATRLEGERFLAENKTKEGVVVLPSGLQYRILKQGDGAVPKLSDKVEVIYEGKTLDGNVFDATSKHGKKSDIFGVGGLIKGWTEALLLMPVGSKWELYIPQELAYGDRGAGRNIKPYSALTFTLELLSIENSEKTSGFDQEKKNTKVVPAKKITPITKKK